MFQILRQSSISKLLTFRNFKLKYCNQYFPKNIPSPQKRVVHYTSTPGLLSTPRRSNFLSEPEEAGGKRWLSMDVKNRDKKVGEEKKEMTPAEVTEGPPPSLSPKERLKLAMRDYGSTVIVFHITISLCSLGMFYLLVSSGLDMVYILSKIGVGEEFLQSKITQGTSTFVVAYAVHKLFAPARIGITLTASPLIVKKLRKMGILKPTKPTTK